MMGWDTVTCWHRDGAGGWRRTVVSGVRVECSLSAEPSAVGPVPGGETKCYFFSFPDVEPGDALMVGAHGDAEPPEGALEVRRVDPYSVRHLHHHTEVTAQ